MTVRSGTGLRARDTARCPVKRGLMNANRNPMIQEPAAGEMTNPNGLDGTLHNAQRRLDAILTRSTMRRALCLPLRMKMVEATGIEPVS